MYSKTLELGRVPDAVPSEFVVVRVGERADEINGGGAVADEVPGLGVLLSSDVVSGAKDEAWIGAEDSGAAENEDDDDDDDAMEDEARPDDGSAALPKDDTTLGDRTAELMGIGPLGAGSWLEGGGNDSLGDGSEVVLLGSWVALLGS